MSGRSDQAKGRIKEAYGVLRGDEKLQAEGRHDQSAGEAKTRAARAEDKVDRMAGKAKRKAAVAEDKFDQGVDKAKDAIENAMDRVKKAVQPPE